MSRRDPCESEGKRSFEQDTRTGPFDCTFSLKTGECLIEGFTTQTQLARDVLQLASEIYNSGVEVRMKVEVKRHSFFGGANFHEFKTLPQINYLMRHQREEGHDVSWIGAKGL